MIATVRVSFVRESLSEVGVREPDMMVMERLRYSK